jgi:hypothetical protein
MARIRILGLCLVAVFALSAVAAATASAVGGPIWIVKKSGVTEELAAGKTVGVESTSTPVEFKLKTTIKGITGTIKCKVLVVSAAELIGGKPGTDKNVNEFKECKGEGFAALCTVSSATGVSGVIGPFGVKTTLVFPAGGARALALDRFLPEAGTEFVKFKLSGGLCPDVGTVNVKGCVLAEVWQGGASAASGALAAENELEFPATPITAYEIWTGSAFKSETGCSLTSQFGTETPSASTQVGRVKVGFTAAAKTAGYEQSGWRKE